MITDERLKRIHLCPLQDVMPGSATGFCVQTPAGPRDIILVRHNEDCLVYLNSCPHTGVSLDWQPGQFLDSSGTLLQCSTHGALFRFEDGLCIYGPCVNRSLTALPTEIEDGQIYLL